MKIYISYPMRDTPFGGGNQFIKALANVLDSQGLLADTITAAQIILTNGFYFQPLLNSYDSLFMIKRNNPEVKILHRVDGVANLIRGQSSIFIDKIVSAWASICIDGAIFQSDYCRDIQYKYGYPQYIPYAIIGNACDKNIFYPQKTRNSSDKRIRLIYTSWSNNMRKGFPTLQMLDKTLDFTRFSFTFVGNSPVTFKNIRHISAKPSAELADLLRESDIFLGLSHYEPCSNAIGEALACGLPVLIRNTGGNPSFVPQGAVLYNNDEDILPMLNYIVANLTKYRTHVRPLDINKIANQYITFAEQILTKPAQSPNCHKFLALRKELRAHFSELPKRRAWCCKLWLEGLLC